jgi:hypothetical protein
MDSKCDSDRLSRSGNPDCDTPVCRGKRPEDQILLQAQNPGEGALGRPLRRRDIPLDGDSDDPAYRLLRERTPRRAAVRLPDTQQPDKWVSGPAMLST